MHRFFFPLFTFLLSFTFLTSAEVPVPDLPTPDLPLHLQDGFVVWESNRNGPWRIFRRNLAGGPVEQVTPDEPGRDHFAAHISPNGKRIVYLSYPQGRHGYRKQPPEIVIPMYMLELDGRTPPVKIMDNARPYGEHRAAVWVSDTRLYTICERYISRKLYLDLNDRGRAVVDRPDGRSWDHGYLLDPTGQFAFSGVPGFLRVDAESRSVIPGEMYRGCQPFVTRDAIWGYWMQGMGGPISRVHLATGRTGTIVEKNDPRMPPDRAYLYFPHISPCNQLIVFAASPDEHDHHKSDYDLFVAPLDPSTLTLSGPPQRFTFDPATDRFPEVYIPPLDFETVAAKAPFRHHLDPEANLPDWQWSVNGDPISGAEHLFSLPGQYLVTATREGETRRGLVAIRPPTPPKLLSAALDRDGTILLRFNEPVDLSDAAFEADDLAVTPESTSDSHAVRLRLPEAPKGPITLSLTGIRDTAQHPNVMPPAILELQTPQWPADPEGLVLIWESGNGQRHLFPPNADSPVRLNLRPQNRARFTAHQAMLLDGGAFLAPDADAVLLETLKSAPGLTIEAVIHARKSHQTGPARIISFSTGTGARNFTLGQEAERFVLRLRTDNTSANAHEHTLDLGPIDTEAPVHVLLSYRPGSLTAYLNGEPVAEHTTHEGAFDSWTRHSLIFGAETDGGRDWAGTLQGVAIYARHLDAEEARANAQQAALRLAAQAPVPVIEVEARLVAATPVPKLAEIDPYRSIMVVHEYERIRQISGPDLPRRFRVHHWGLLDARPYPLPASEPGQVTTLLLEPFSAHSHLQELFPADTLEPDFDIPIFLDTTP